MVVGLGLPVRCTLADRSLGTTPSERERERERVTENVNNNH